MFSSISATAEESTSAKEELAPALCAAGGMGAVVILETLMSGDWATGDFLCGLASRLHFISVPGVAVGMAAADEPPSRRDRACARAAGRCPHEREKMRFPLKKDSYRIARESTVVPALGSLSGGPVSLPR